MVREAELRCKRLVQACIGATSHPGDVSVGSNQDGFGGGYMAQIGEFPRPGVLGVDGFYPMRPW